MLGEIERLIGGGDQEVFAAGLVTLTRGGSRTDRDRALGEVQSADDFQYSQPNEGGSFVGRS
jgi:hypothetical protein